MEDETNLKVVITCELCSLEFEQENILKQHMITNHPPKEASQVEEETVSCIDCDFDGTSNRELADHVKKEHKDKKGNVTDIPGDFVLSEFFCKICPFVATNNDDIQNHSIEHEKDSTEKVIPSHPVDSPLPTVTMFQCNVCDYKNSREDFLQTHVDFEHMNNAYTFFSCKQCNFVSQNEDSLKVHTSTIHGTQPNYCKQCDFKAQDHASLWNHMLGVHNGGFINMNFTENILLNTIFSMQKCCFIGTCTLTYYVQLKCLVMMLSPQLYSPP